QMKISHLVTYVNGLGRCEDTADCRSRGAGGGRPGRDDKSHLSRRAFGPGLLRRWRAWAAMSASSAARRPPPITPRPVRIEQAGLYHDPVSLKDSGESRLGAPDGTGASSSRLDGTRYPRRVRAVRSLSRSYGSASRLSRSPSI